MKRGKKMNVLLIGSGGREHALADQIDRSPLLTKLYAAPGNPGMAMLAECVALDTADHEAVVQFAKDHDIGLVVIGPEAPLVAGLADDLEKAGIPAFGPSAMAAQLEGSKDFARAFCARHNIPQPQFASFDQVEAARGHLAEHYPDGYVVIKADGLAAGKGVVVSDTMDQAMDAIAMMLEDNRFGDAGARMVIEDRIEGTEASLFAMVDGNNAIMIGSAQDHKRAYDNDEGPNTGGMGAVSPAPALTDALCQQAWDDIVLPVVRGMAEEGTPYRGFLYTGLMLTKTGPQVIEFNCRFGDPEAQTILPRLKSDLLSAMATANEGGLGHTDLRFHDGAAVTVVMVNGGYPGSYEKGGVIQGLTPDDQDENIMVFHAGTAEKDGAIIATGGRVLAVTGMASDQASARKAAYDRVAGISWPNVFFRKDIAQIK